MPKRILGAERRTNPLIWLVAIVCAVLAIAVIITGATVFAVYMIYQPKTPDVRVVYAQLIVPISYDRYGSLAVRMVVNLLVENTNMRVHATFSEFAFSILFRGVRLAQLRAGPGPFEVPKNSSLALHYEVETATVPLDREGMDEVDRALKGGTIGFLLAGRARTAWMVGPITSLKTHIHLNCNLQFSAANGSSVGLSCKSTSG